MKDEEKTKKQLIDELAEMRQRIAELEVLESKRKRVKKAILKAEEELKAIFDSVRDGIALLDMTGKVTKVNKRIVDVGGYSEEEIMGKRIKLLKMFTPSSIAKMIYAFAKTISGQQVPPYEVELYTKTRKKINVELHGSLLRKEGKVVGIVAVMRDITERKQAEETLQESEEKYRNVVERATDGITIVQDTLIKYINPRLAEMTGYTFEESIETPFTDYIHHEELPKLIDRYKRRMAGEDVTQRYETALRHKDGSKIDVEFNAGIITYQGKPADLVIIRDITEHKQAEEELRESEEKYQSLVESTEDSIFLLDRNCKYLFMNKKHLSRLVLEPEKAKGRTYAEFHSEDDTRELVGKVEKVFQAGKSLYYEYRSQRDGRYFVRTLSPVKKTDGSTKAVTVISKDINELKQAEEALQGSEEKYRLLIENQTDLVVKFDTKGRFLFASPSYCEMFGKKEEELMGKKFMHMVHKDYQEITSKAIEDLYRPPYTSYLEQRVLAKGKWRWVAWATKAVLDEGNNVIAIVSSGRDITELKMAEEEKERLQAQLLQVQKMEAIGILAGGVAHDFNNILQTIQGYTDLAMMKLDEADPLYRDLKQIDLSAGRAANLTRQLLLFSRRQPMEFIPLSLNNTVENLLKMLHRLIGEDITINTELDSELWTVQADAGTLEQVIMNLTINARDAMPEGGTLTIKTENMHVDEDYCKTYTYARPGRFVCISVQDTGSGMDKEIIDSIFEPFFTTKGPGKGTGMGLSVVYGIVKQHEGWVNVYSEPGQGSTLKIYLPASSLKVEEETEETISLEELQGNGERILLVEDEEEVREFTTMVLGENGYVVCEAASAEEALDIFDKEAGNFDLIFSDVVLPGKSGIQLVDQLISHKPEIRILLSSGYTDHKSQWPVIRERGFRFLQKPYGLTDLLRAIREAIGQDK